MKKNCLLLMFILLTFTGCKKSMETEITEDKFENNLEIFEFESKEYIMSIEGTLKSVDYIRIDSIFQSTNVAKHIITNKDMEHILSTFDTYKADKTTYELINFLDMHIKKMSLLEIDIILLQIIEQIEIDYDEKYQLLTEEAMFKHITQDGAKRLSTTLIENYVITEEELQLYPTIGDDLEDLYRILYGGYQLKLYSNKHVLYPDYASVLTRYDDYFSDETNMLVDILVRESRKIFVSYSNMKVDNKDVAYKINKIELFINKYPNSMYYDVVKELYIKYFVSIVQNENNYKEITERTTKYTRECLDDFEKIIEQYINTELTRLLKELYDTIDQNNGIYNEEVIDEIIKKIKLSY